MSPYTGVNITDPPIAVLSDIRSDSVLAIGSVFSISTVLSVRPVFTVLTITAFGWDVGIDRITCLLIDNYPFSGFRIYLRSKPILTVFSVSPILAVGSRITFRSSLSGQVLEELQN